MVATMPELDALLSDIDWTYPHAGVTFLCAVTAFIKMQCLTASAGFASSDARGYLYLRLTLGLLSIALALNCYLTIQEDIAPWWPDTLCRLLLLFTLLTVPYALPQRLRRS